MWGLMGAGLFDCAVGPGPRGVRYGRAVADVAGLAPWDGSGRPVGRQGMGGWAARLMSATVRAPMIPRTYHAKRRRNRGNLPAAARICVREDER